MKLNVYPCPEHGIFISAGNLAECLEKGEADVYCYGDEAYMGWLKHNPDGALHSPFERLLSAHRLDIREALAREIKWAALLLIYVWLPFRHYVAPALGWVYQALIGLSLYMMVGAFVAILRNWRKLKQLPTLLEKFKISSIRPCPARPRHPCSAVRDAPNKAIAPNIKLWAAFLTVCLLISSIVPVSATWIIVHPLGGQDYVTSGPTLIRPLSSWYIVPKTHRTFVWIPLRMSEDATKVWVYEYEVEWKITNPKDYRPKEWRLTLDRLLTTYFMNVMEMLMRQMAVDYPDMKEAEQERMAVEYLSVYISEINKVIDEQLGSPMPIVESKGKIRVVTMNEFGNYYRQTRSG